MALPALVLVHGGAHAGDCWDLTINEIHRLAPELDVLAVDLPGRREKPGDLRTLTIEDWVNSVVADVDADGLDDVVIVGHSMAGVTVPGVVTKLGASRVREMIFAAACVPAEGSAMVDVVAPLTAMIARRNAKKGAPYTVPSLLARLFSSTVRPVCDADSWQAACIRSPIEFFWRRCRGPGCPRMCRVPGSSPCVTARIRSKSSAPASRRSAVCRQ